LVRPMTGHGRWEFRSNRKKQLVFFPRQLANVEPGLCLFSNPPGTHAGAPPHPHLSCHQSATPITGCFAEQPAARGNGPRCMQTSGPGVPRGCTSGSGLYFWVSSHGSPMAPCTTAYWASTLTNLAGQALADNPQRPQDQQRGDAPEHLLGGHHSPPHACHNALAAQPGRDVLQGRQVHLAARVGGRWAVGGNDRPWRIALGPVHGGLGLRRVLGAAGALQQGLAVPLAALVVKQSTQLYMPFHASTASWALGARPQRARVQPRADRRPPFALPAAPRAAAGLARGIPAELCVWPLEPAPADASIHSTAGPAWPQPRPPPLALLGPALAIALRSGNGAGLVRICPVGVLATGQTAFHIFFRSGFAGTGRPGCPVCGEQRANLSGDRTV
jgi:hypothetical protein